MLAFLALVALAATASARVESEPLVQCGSGWIPTGRAAADATHSAKIVITAQNTEKLTEIALAVSDPRSPMYGEHLSKDEVNQLTAPRAEHVVAVVDWLNRIEVAHTVNTEQGTITIRDSVAKVEELFNTRISTHKHLTTERTVLRASDFEIPAELEGAIATIFGMHELPLPPHSAAVVSTNSRTKRSMSDRPKVTPAMLNKVYNISGVKASGSLKNRQAVAEFLGESPSSNDVREFYKQFLPALDASDAEIYAIHGTQDRLDGGIDANVEMQTIMGLAPGVKTEFYANLKMLACADFLAWTQLLLATEDLPLVHSVSWFYQGYLFGNLGCKADNIATVEANFAKLAARGITILFASGDSGSGFEQTWPPMAPGCSFAKPGTKGVVYSGETTATQDFDNSHGNGAYLCCSFAREYAKSAGWSFVPSTTSAKGTCTVFSSIAKNSTASASTVSGLPPPAPGPAPPGPTAKLWPSWPASSPWVTAVGATRFINNVAGGPQAAVSAEDEVSSGGGFSVLYDAPEWQKEAVATYFKTVDPSTLPDKTKVAYPAGGRATPDVATLGSNVQVYARGGVTTLSGTLASTPIFSAMVSLLNEARLQAGKKPLGLLNPFLYQNADAFTDITVGDNRDGNMAGFNCSAGWDPVTGLGTPVFSKLLAAALAAK